MENTSPSSLYARPRTYLTQNQKLMILEENRNDGVPISILARKHGIHPITIYQWKKKMDQDENELIMDKIKEILLENARLKKRIRILKSKLPILALPLRF
jgi:transposase-like protein